MDDFVHGLDPDPHVQFDRWLAEASATGIPHPEAMTLATATADGHPSARMVLLKGHLGGAFRFYTNHGSRKAADLVANPRAALVFLWEQPRERQVRIEGLAERLSAAESSAYFAERPRGSQLAAWASPQSSPVADRVDLVARYEAAASRFGASVDVPLPPFWGGYAVVPDAIEFWQNSENRLHDRVRYERDGDGWRRLRLAP